MDAKCYLLCQSKMVTALVKKQTMAKVPSELILSLADLGMDKGR